MTRVRWLSAGALVAVALAGPANAEAPAPAIKSVLELFTSQGCSSCPPADVLLAQLGKNPDIVTLSYSVDYWNYLGWHDTLSSAANSERQRDYARMRGDRQAQGQDRLIVRQLAEQLVGRRAGRAALAGEQFDDGARFRDGGCRRDDSRGDHGQW